MYHSGLPSFIVDDPYQSGFGASGSGEARPGSPNGDRNSDTPQTHEQLIAYNSSLKTRVSELEVINELFRGRLSQLEQQEATARAEQTQLRVQLEANQESEAQLRTQLEDVHSRENSLKRRLDELELELKEAKGGSGSKSDRPAKRARTEEGEASKPEEETVAEEAKA